MRKPGLTTKEILNNIAMGLLFVVAYSSPYGAQRINSYIFKQTKKKVTSNWKKRIKELHQKGYIVLGNEEIKLTNKGRRMLKEFEVPHPNFDAKNWDKKWRIITYDIPETKRKGRDKLRELLIKWNCLEIQKSVFITPFDCKQEVAVATKEFNLNRYIFYFSTNEVLNESKYLKYYGIK